jgi:hypothetical protein
VSELAKYDREVERRKLPDPGTSTNGRVHLGEMAGEGLHHRNVWDAPDLA